TLTKTATSFDGRVTVPKWESTVACDNPSPLSTLRCPRNRVNSSNPSVRPLLLKNQQACYVGKSLQCDFDSEYRIYIFDVEKIEPPDTGLALGVRPAPRACPSRGARPSRART